MFNTNLESVHLPTAHIVVYSSSKDVHGVLNHSSSVEESPTGHLRRREQSTFNFTYRFIEITKTLRIKCRMSPEMFGEEKLNSKHYFSYLTVQTGVDHLPALRIHIVAVQFVGQRVVSSTSKYIQVAVEGNHSVAVTSLRRRRGASQ